jgi:hypothetical protein
MVYNCMQEMPRASLHVVHLRLTHEEWRLVAEMARLRRLSIEELLREGLRLSRLDALPSHQAERSRLQLLAPRAETRE